MGIILVNQPKLVLALCPNPSNFHKEVHVAYMWHGGAMMEMPDESVVRAFVAEFGESNTTCIFHLCSYCIDSGAKVEITLS